MNTLAVFQPLVYGAFYEIGFSAGDEKAHKAHQDHFFNYAAAFAKKLQVEMSSLLAKAELLM